MKCNICGKEFSREQDLLVHQFEDHNKPCICHNPQYRTYGLQFMSTRLDITYPGQRTVIKKYKCVYCGAEWTLVNSFSNGHFHNSWECKKEKIDELEQINNRN